MYILYLPTSFSSNHLQATIVLAYSVFHQLFCSIWRDRIASLLNTRLYINKEYAYLILNLLIRVIVPLLLTISLGSSPTNLGYSLPNIIKGILLTAILLPLTIIFNTIVIWSAIKIVKERHAIKKVKSWKSGIGPKEMTTLALWVICEEAFYRGFILMELSSLGFTVSILISSLLFSIAHIYTGIIWSLMSFINGIMYSYAMIETKSLLVPIILHYILNIVPFIRAYHTFFRKIINENERIENN